MSGASPVLEMRGVTRSFAIQGGSVAVLCGVDLAVAPGDFVALTGPSGSGKSTLLHLAALLDVASSGSLLFDAVDLQVLTDPQVCRLRAESVGMVFQRYCLLPHRTVLQNVLLRFRYLPHTRAEARERSLEALDTLGLAALADRTVRLLSGGEMQRVAIARAVALAPKLLVADEPTGNLDRAAALAVMECFTRLNRAGITILMGTHNEELLRSCGRRLRLRDGLLKEHG